MRHGEGDRRSNLLLASVLGLLLVLTLVVLFDPGVAPAFINRPLDLVLTAAAVLVTVAVAILAWVRYREGHDLAALFRASAFLVLAGQNLVFIGILVAGRSMEMGLDLRAPGQLPLWSAGLGRLLAAGLFVAAGVIAVSGQVQARWSAPAVLVSPILLLAVATAGMIAAPEALPVLLDAAALDQLQREPTAPLLGGGSLLLVGLQAVIGLAFLASAGASYLLYRRTGREAESYLAVGFLLAAFSQVHSAMHPGSYASLVTVGDLLRVAFYAVLLLAMAAEARDNVRALHLANAELRQLREADVARATAEERARLAREIHDGMSQELWYAKLKQSRLLSVEGLPDEARQLGLEVSHAVEAALSEARQAILALRPAEGATFSQVLERFVAEFADRFGIPADCHAAREADALSARHQAELLRIVQEALTNVRRHADATRVRVRAEAANGVMRLFVADNGRGFPVGEVDDSRYGLLSMRERANVIGARLQIESAPSDGTRITVELPMEASR